MRTVEDYEKRLADFSHRMREQIEINLKIARDCALESISAKDEDKAEKELDAKRWLLKSRQA